MNGKKLTLLVILLLILDQALKIWVKTHMTLGEAIILIPDWFQLYFIENKGARIYKTAQVYNLDLIDTLAYLEKYVEPLPGTACIRVEAEPTHPIFTNMEELKKLYPTITWSKLPKDDSDTEVKEVVFSDTELQTWVPISLNKTNIVDILLNRLSSKLNEQELASMKEELQELL